MLINDVKLKNLLDSECAKRDSFCELSYEKPDPLLVAQRLKDEYAILLCALFGYGKASLIVKFLEQLNFALLEEKETVIEKELSSLYYRFQNAEDIIHIFITLRRMKQENSLNTLFTQIYKKEHNVLEALDYLIKQIYTHACYHSQGFTFLVGTPLKRDKNGCIKFIGNAPYKRWMMYLRWVVRKDCLDLGLWKDVHRSDLILPLDTHTFKVSQKLGLLKRQTYDLQSAVHITQKLKEFDAEDPVKYDFALYRLGQEKLFF